ncbi:MAG TPA: RNA-binding S4 domain-containing protein [Candidatus Baltobacteraceae bacterium]|nr:RNA-binding S4 domain-containing protein [Candidatus Baltobacteraceae bacterium]
MTPEIRIHNDAIVTDISLYCQFCDSLPLRPGAAFDARRGTGDSVRLDKFMKVSRLARRRSEAHEALEHGRITKDGKTLKPGYQVKPGDEFEIHYATKFVTVRVREVPLRVTPSVKAADLYEILDSRKGDSEWV